MRNKSKSSTANLFFSSLVGGVVGAAGVMIMTTERGESIRNEIAKLTNLKNVSLSQTLLELGQEWND